MRRIRLADSVRRISLLFVLMLMIGSIENPVMAKSSRPEVRLYFLVGGELAATTRTVPDGHMIANETLFALFTGPEYSELAIGQRTALPLGLPEEAPLTIDATTKTATVSLPSIFTSNNEAVEAQRTAQVVYTLTQFPTITSVKFVIDGKAYKPLTVDGKRASGAVGRADYESLAPAILIEAASGYPLHVTGTANTFEAEFSYKLYDASNKKIAGGNVMATSGSGSRGTFTVDIPYRVKSAQTGTLVAFELSAKDGSVVNLVAVPVALTSK